MDDSESAPRNSEVSLVNYAQPSLPGSAYNGAPDDSPYHIGDCPPDDQEMPYPNPWRPDGLEGPWPYDEYIYDGGDRETPVVVRRDRSVLGLDTEDTVVQYETRQGRTMVQPSNRVPIYAPRFAAVRKVYGLNQNQSRESTSAFLAPLRANSQDYRVAANTAVQPLQPIIQHGMRTAVNLRERVRGLTVDDAKLPFGMQAKLMPHEDLSIIRRGEENSREHAELAQRALAAIAWSSDQAVQVVLDGKLATQATGRSAPQETTLYELPEGKNRVRIVKVASKSEAQPGEEIDFTIRFDNVGDQRVDKVTIIDSLTTRLEYVPESAQCSLPSAFMTQENEGESLVLRWEIAGTLKVGEGGIIRFKCRVR